MRRVVMESLILTKDQVLFEIPDDIPDDKIDKWICKTKERYDSSIVDSRNLGQVDYDYHIVDLDGKELIPWMGTFKRENS